MATINTLANETLIHIMKLLRDPPPRLWDNPNSSLGRYDALRAAALVCSRWRDPAQQALFEGVEISEEYTLRAGRFPASPAGLRLRTRSLFVGRGALDWIEIAEACEALQSVDLFCVEDFNPSVLARPCFARLRSLTIAAGSLPVEWLDPGFHLSTGLTSLALWTTFDQPALALISAIANSSIGTLDTLHLRLPSEVPEERLSLAFRVVGPNLRTFILDSWHTSLKNDLDFFSSLSSIISFSWSSPSRFLLETDDAEYLRTILDAFPSPATLDHLRIGIGDFSSLEHTTVLLKHPALSVLTKLDLPRLPSSTPAEVASDVAAMAKACEDREIQWSMGGVDMRL